MTSENSIAQSVENSKIIRPLNEAETNQFLDYYKDLLLSSIDKQKYGPLTEELYEKIRKLSYVNNKIDAKCCLKINKRLVRIEYPGDIKNVEKAMQTLGGIENIEAIVADQKKKLELHFHPENCYNKPLFADKDFKPGLLIKVNPKKADDNPSSSTSSEVEAYDYEVVGISVMNFLFNRLCDFQYLPLVAKEQPETKSSSTEFIYEKILPKSIPDMGWFGKEELKNMDPFLLPVRFSHYDNSNAKFNVDNVNDRSEDILPNENSVEKAAAQKRKKICTIFGKQAKLSIFVDFFKDKDIPIKPLESTVKYVSIRSAEEEIARAKQLFEERPIWTKAAVLYNSGISPEHAKFIIPMVAYFFNNGPWRSCWVKFGYDPRKDPQARIYQTLDYRIRTLDSAQLKVNTKRTYASKCILTLGPNHSKRVSLKDDISTKPRLELDERCYVLRPLTIPPARQLFYQFCDLLLPEIQDKISRLILEKNCDSKNGWLPKKFVDEAREIVNNYVIQAVHLELLKDNKELQEKEKREEDDKKGKDKGGLDYCQQMLNNVKKGIYQNVKLNMSGPTLGELDLKRLGDDVEMIDLSDSEEEGEFTVGDIIQNSIPERIDNEENEEDLEIDEEAEESDADIDMEVVEEINKLIKQNDT